MTDNLSKEKRRRVMVSIRGKNTIPELAIRRGLWALGKRYRIHDRTVSGTPDISNRGKKVAVFIDGCFWHQCPTCYKKHTTNVIYWRQKVEINAERRRRVQEALRRDDWTVLEFWEHEVLRDTKSIINYVASRI